MMKKFIISLPPCPTVSHAQLCSGNNPRLNDSLPAAVFIFFSPSPKARQMCHWVIQCQKCHLLSHCGQQIRVDSFALWSRQKKKKDAELGCIWGTGWILTWKNICKHKMNRQQFNYMKISLNDGLYPSINQKAFLDNPLMFLVNCSIRCEGIKLKLKELTWNKCSVMWLTISLTGFRDSDVAIVSLSYIPLVTWPQPSRHY